jgi:hypothetical protein
MLIKIGNRMATLAPVATVAELAGKRAMRAKRVTLPLGERPLAKRDFKALRLGTEAFRTHSHGIIHITVVGSTDDAPDLLFVQSETAPEVAQVVVESSHVAVVPAVEVPRLARLASQGLREAFARQTALAAQRDSLPTLSRLANGDGDNANHDVTT